MLLLYPLLSVLPSLTAAVMTNTLFWMGQPGEHTWPTLTSTSYP
jgi:hypothetical protein